MQSKLDYGLSIWGCTAEGKLDLVQRIQNFCARIIYSNYDYINTTGMNLVELLKLQTIRERRDNFLCVLMFKCIHGLAPHYLSNDATMVVCIHGYNTRSSENMDLYVPRCTTEPWKRSFLDKGSMLWNDLPDSLKESSSLDVFTSNSRFIIVWQVSEYIWVSLFVDLHSFFNSSHISIMFLHFTEAPMCVLNHVCTLLSGSCTKVYIYIYIRIIYQIFYWMTFILCWYAICQRV